MTMVKKSISITDQEDEWIKSRLETGQYENESDVLRELILERQIQEQETPEQIAEIRKALIEGERSGFSDRSVHEFIKEARARRDAERHD